MYFGQQNLFMIQCQTCWKMAYVTEFAVIYHAEMTLHLPPKRKYLRVRF